MNSISISFPSSLGSLLSKEFFYSALKKAVLTRKNHVLHIIQFVREA